MRLYEYNEGAIVVGFSQNTTYISTGIVISVEEKGLPYAFQRLTMLQHRNKIENGLFLADWNWNWRMLSSITKYKIRKSWEFFYAAQQIFMSVHNSTAFLPFCIFFSFSNRVCAWIFRRPDSISWWYIFYITFNTRKTHICLQCQALIQLT